jgi:GGDEF domain-containing protein
MLTGLPNTNGYLREVGRKYVMGMISLYDAYYFNLKGFGLVNKRFGQREGNEILIRYVGELKKFFQEDEYSAVCYYYNVKDLLVFSDGVNREIPSAAKPLKDYGDD